MLLEVARAPEATVRELAERTQMTERQAHRVLADLTTEGYLVKSRTGRRNSYRVNEDAPMRRSTYADHTVRELLSILREP